MNSPAVSELLRRCGTSWISTKWIDRLVLSRDASLYRLVPLAVARPRTAAEVRTLLSTCHEVGLHITFRAAGTSLSGQAVTNGILVDLSRGWDQVDVLDKGARLRAQPGVTGGRVNAKLAPFHRKIGPDPASINAAMIGGIVANNASGMCCGTSQNTYHTMESIRFMLADGTTIDTATNDADEVLSRTRPDIHAGMIQLRDSVRADTTLCDLIRRKYQIKNTMGYALNAFLDEHQPARILARLMVGSEGTLGFIENVVYNTVPDPAEKHTALFVYDSIEAACATVQQWRSAGAAAVEIMDDASIRSFSSLPHTPEIYRIYKPGRAALLVEFHGHLPDVDGQWVSSPRERNQIWALRKGLMPTVGALRPSGSTMINEDIAVPPENLSALLRDVKGAFHKHGYADAIIFGHAKDGNIHFVINQDFAVPGELERYRSFMDTLAEIVVDTHHGSLKAEHGTGRNMAPFVEKEWGSVAYQLMHQVKQLVDPSGVLNPEVILSADPLVHTKNIKSVPHIDDSVNSCIECGFCEHVCPTRSITLTPRQRIVLERELLDDLSDIDRSEILKDAQWMADDSCAVDGICASACPVNINTATLVKSHRAASAGALASFVANNLGSRPQLVDTLARFGSTAASMVMPSWPLQGRPDTSRPNRNEVEQPTAPPEVIYSPSCPSRWFGMNGNGVTISEMVRWLSATAGIRLGEVESGTVCCGQIFESKGYDQAAERTHVAGKRYLQEAFADTSIALVTDVSTCASAYVHHAHSFGRPVITPLEYIEEWILPRVSRAQSIGHVVVHPGCGVEATHEVDRLLRIVQWCAESVSVPPGASCCGMAGDHGLRHPGIVDAATLTEIQDLEQIGPADAYVSLNPVCQSGLEQRSAKPWISVWDLLSLCVAGTTAETPDSSR